MALVMTAVNVCAAGLNFTQNPDDSMVISGTAGASLKRQSVTVYITNLEDSSITVKTGTTNTDGSFEFDWLPKKSGEYSVEVRAGASFLSDTYWYSSVREYNDIMTIMKTGNAEAVKGVITDAEKLSVIHIDYDDVKDYNAQTLATALCLLRDYTNGADRVLDLLDDAKLISDFIYNKTPAAFASANPALIRNGITLTDYSFYYTMTDSGLKALIAAVFADKLSLGLNDADTVFTDCIVLTAVENTSSWSLLDPYLSLLHYAVYDSSAYKDTAAIAVAGETYQNRTLLMQAINTALNPSQNNQGNNSGNGGGGGGGGNAKDDDDEETILTIPAQLPSFDKEETKGERVVFTDVTESHWAFDAINYLRWEGVVMGSDFNNYYPENTVTRAEITAMLTRAYKISGGESNFSDVDTGAWYYAPISAAFSRGLVSGDGEAFHPGENITRQDLAAMIYRFAKDSGVEFASGELNFPDNSDISDYAKEAVAALANAGIIRGVDGGFFAPMQNATRAQAAQLIYTALRYK